MSVSKRNNARIRSRVSRKPVVPELVEKEKEELSILNGYLPQAMSPGEISKVVRETIAEAGATSRAQMGAVMKALQAKVAGRVDGKALSAEVQKQLS